MERLTYRLNDQFDNPTDSIILMPYLRYEDPETRKKILNRLAAYEDSGLEPEDIKKHEAAYNECLTRTYGPFKQKISQWLQAEQDGRLHITPEFVWHNGDSGLHKVPYKPWMEKWIATGTKFWLTREEAEAALAQKGGSNEQTGNHGEPK